MRLFITLFILVFCGFSCSSNLEKEIIGTWKMEAVLDGSTDVSKQHNPDNDRWIEFRADQTFKSGGGPFGENTGKWLLEENSAELFLDSDAGQDDDSYWIVNIEKADMSWKGIRSDFGERFTLKHTKVKP